MWCSRTAHDPRSCTDAPGSYRPSPSSSPSRSARASWSMPIRPAPPPGWPLPGFPSSREPSHGPRSSSGLPPDSLECSRFPQRGDREMFARSNDPGAGGMSVESGGSYIHGTAPEEQARLSSLNDLLNRAALRELGLRGGEKIVDFGAGLGQLTRDMARAAKARVVGIERSPKQIAEAMRQAAAASEESLLELRQGDVQEGVPRAEEGSYDLAHARFVLEHVPDPLVVVKAMMKAVRPGGRLVLQDDDHDILRLWPEPP